MNILQTIRYHWNSLLDQIFPREDQPKFVSINSVCLAKYKHHSSNTQDHYWITRASTNHRTCVYCGKSLL